MSVPSPRQELLKLHQQIYRKNKAIIEESVIHEDRDFKAYERRYLNAVRNYQKITTAEKVIRQMLAANIVYVGDYHTLNQSQRSMLRTLRMFIPHTKNFAIGMEVIQARHQPILDRYLKGRITDQTFLKQIGFKEHWFFDLWENFKPIFDFAKYHGIPVYGIEADPTDARSLGDRDVAAAQKIFEIHQADPDRKLLVFIGDLHLAPPHLPKQVKKVFKKAVPNLKTVTLYQNSESIYWQLAKKGREDQVNAVQISKTEFCRMHTPPIICQQSYLNWLEHEEGALDFADAKQTFLGYVGQIAQFLGIKLNGSEDEVEVFTCGDLSFLRRLRETKAFSPRELKEIKRQILRSESYTIPKKKYVYLANVSVNHAAEEASHTLKFLCSGEEFPRPMQDAFYANILHEALGFFGSKIVNSKRKCLRPAGAKQLVHYLDDADSIGERILDYKISQLFLEHEARAKKGESFHANKIAPLSVDLFMGVTHAIGYYLGEQMFYGLLQHKLTKKNVKDLFEDPLEEDGEPLKAYFSLLQNLKGTRLPRRV